MTRPEPLHPRVPVDRCYWSLVSAPGVRSFGPLPVALLDDLAEDLPIPVNEVFAIAAPVAGDQLLTCAVRRTDLAGVSESALSLVPHAIPAELGLEAQPGLLNFLVGEYEPKALLRVRVRRHAAWVAAMLLAAVLVTVGWARRAIHDDGVASAAARAADTLVAAMAPSHSSVTAGPAIDQELAGLRRRVQGEGAIAPPADASVNLAGLLACWPSKVSSKPQTLGVSTGAIMASVLIETRDTTEFLKAMQAPPGWFMEEPRMNTASGITRVSLSMKPVTSRRKENGGINRP